MPDDDAIPRRPSQTMQAPSFEDEFAHWLKTRDELYRLDLSDEQRKIITSHAASIARKRGMP